MHIRISTTETVQAWPVARLACGSEVWKAGPDPRSLDDILGPSSYWVADAGNARHGGVVRPARPEEIEVAIRVEARIAQALDAGGIASAAEDGED